MHSHDHGLAHDVETLLKRRRTLLWLAAAGAAPLIGCGGGSDADASSAGSSGSSSSSSSSGSTSATASSSSSTSTCSVIPEETAGPYPGDGSNQSSGSTSNVLTLSGIVRSDIRTSVGDASGTAAGVPMTITLTLVNTNSSCASLEGYAIYLWHCNRDGKYSLYSSGITDQNYLRGVQVTDGNGQVTFTTIFPACYSGRWPHIHFEVYPSLAKASGYANKIKTSQIAMPQAVCETVYGNATGYGASVANLSQVSLSTDNVFSDGYSLEVASVTGSVSDGYAATLTVAIAA